MKDTDYNGWTNYETWCVNLWMTNDEVSQNDILELTRFTIKTFGTNPVIELAHALEARVQDERDHTGAGMLVDLLNAALSEVNWHEIAANWIEDSDE
tara:strand:- start:1060 stop:1350 length:291 start_codon:yes stop_codon:yes gene_type:complete